MQLSSELLSYTQSSSRASTLYDMMRCSGLFSTFPISALESAIFPRDHDSFELEIIYRKSKMGPMAACCSWAGRCF